MSFEPSTGYCCQQSLTESRGYLVISHVAKMDCKYPINGKEYAMFQINYCEFNRSNADQDRIYRPGGSGDYLLLLFKTPMKCHLKGKLEISRENACLLYAPGEAQDYQAVQKFRNSYVHFSTDLFLEKQYQLPTSRLLYPEKFQELDEFLRLLQEEYLSRQLYYEDRCRILTEELFLFLSRNLVSETKDTDRETSELKEEFQRLRLRMLSSCEEDWSVERLCWESSLSKSQFFAWYKKFFDSSPKAELLDARMEKARTLLTNEALQVQQAARQCGFTNMQHFSRYFKARYHCSPREYRERLRK